jgi:transaldolase
VSFVASGLWMFYRARDTGLLLAAPVPLTALYTLRVLETFALTSWAQVVVGVPALAALGVVGQRPISFEVFSDEFSEMEAQAREIASWGRQVYVKVPVTNTRGESSAPLIGRLTAAGVKVNVTALTTADQVATSEPHLAVDVPCVVSPFAGRVADTGRNPVPTMTDALELLRRKPKAELLWASPRELLNIFQADAVGCHIITVTNDLLAKLPLVGKDLLRNFLTQKGRS